MSLVFFELFYELKESFRWLTSHSVVWWTFFHTKKNFFSVFNWLQTVKKAHYASYKKVVNNSFGKYFPWKLSFNFCLQSTFFSNCKLSRKTFLRLTTFMHLYRAIMRHTMETKNYYVYIVKCIKANNENFQNKQLKSFPLVYFRLHCWGFNSC